MLTLSQGYHSSSGPLQVFISVSDPGAQAAVMSSITSTSVSIHSLLLGHNKLGKYCQEGNYEDHN